MHKLSHAEELLVEDSRLRRMDRIRLEKERLEKERQQEEKERQLIEDKLATERSALKRQRSFTGGILVLLLIAIGIGWFAFYQKGIADNKTREAEKNSLEAKRQALQAKSIALAAKAQEICHADPTVAFNLALAAYSTDTTQQAVDALAFCLKERRTVFYTSSEKVFRRSLLYFPYTI